VRGCAEPLPHPPPSDPNAGVFSGGSSPFYRGTRGQLGQHPYWQEFQNKPYQNNPTGPAGSATFGPGPVFAPNRRFGVRDILDVCRANTLLLSESKIAAEHGPPASSAPGSILHETFNCTNG